MAPIEIWSRKESIMARKFVILSESPNNKMIPVGRYHRKEELQKSPVLDFGTKRQLRKKG